MQQNYKLGIHNLSSDIATTKASGIYWINTESASTAYSFINQSMEFIQNKIVISSNQNIQNEIQASPKDTKIYILKHCRDVLRKIPLILNGISKSSPFIILDLDKHFFTKLPIDEIKSFICKVGNILKNKKQCFLIFTKIPAFKQNEHLYIELHQTIHGIANLHLLNSNVYEYKALFWSSDYVITAQNIQQLIIDKNQWSQVQQHVHAFSAPLDQDLYLVHDAILHGSPALSDNWKLFSSNQALIETAKQHQAATVVLSIQSNRDVVEITHQVHELRQTCGSRLKIVIQELAPCIRYHDELLLQHCGCNLIVPHTVQLTKLTSMLKSIQGVTFDETLPDDPTPLIDAMRPLSLKGVIQPARFTQAVRQLTKNPLLPVNSKGILVVFSAKAPLKPNHILTICKLRREGDFICATPQHIWVFLFGCQIEFLNKTMHSLFSLDFVSISQQVQYWHQDNEIIQQLPRITSKISVAHSTDENGLSSTNPSALTSVHSQTAPAPTPLNLSEIFHS